VEGGGGKCVCVCVCVCVHASIHVCSVVSVCIYVYAFMLSLCGFLTCCISDQPYSLSQCFHDELMVVSIVKL